jgi:hypothetical protein
MSIPNVERRHEKVLHLQQYFSGKPFQLLFPFPKLPSKIAKTVL